MFLIKVNKSLFLFYILIFFVSHALNFFTLKNMNNIYLDQQKRYNDLANKLEDDISLEIENTNEEIYSLEQTYDSNFHADVDQLKKRGDRVLLSMTQSSVERYNFYLKKRDSCASEIRNLIDLILV